MENRQEYIFDYENYKEHTDYNFNITISTKVLNGLTEAFNNMIADDDYFSPLVFRPEVEKYLRKKAQITKTVICDYIDEIVDSYGKTRIKRS